MRLQAKYRINNYSNLKVYSLADIAIFLPFFHECIPSLAKIFRDGRALGKKAVRSQFREDIIRNPVRWRTQAYQRTQTGTYTRTYERQSELMEAD